MNQRLFGASIAILFSFIVSGTMAQDLETVKRSLFEIGKGSLVRITVTGRKADMSSQFNEQGTAFYYQSSSGQGRLLTARHVVGADAEFDKRADGKPDRRLIVTIWTPQEGAVERPQKDFYLEGYDGWDVAFININAQGPAQKFRMAKGLPRAGDRVLILSWPTTESTIQPPSEATIGAPTGKDGWLLRVTRQSGQFLKSESGSPVFDKLGRVIGILVLRNTSTTDTQPTGWILPVAEFANWFADGTIGPAPIEFAECYENELAQLREHKSFSVENGVLCKGLGGADAVEAKFEAENSFHIVGQVSKHDRSRFGTISERFYDRKGTDYIKVVRARVQCFSGSSPFNSGWASTSLSGFVERIVTQNEKDRIVRFCRGE